MKTQDVRRNDDTGDGQAGLEKTESLTLQMNGLVAARAQGDEIDFDICSEVTSRTNVVNFEFARTSAILTTPTVPLQYLRSKATIRGQI